MKKLIFALSLAALSLTAVKADAAAMGGSIPRPQSTLSTSAVATSIYGISL